MVGIIVCGHAQFAEGIMSAQELLIGEQNFFDVVSFDGIDTEDFKEKLENAINNLDICKNIIILCDMVEGSPFQISSEFLKSHKNIRLIGGVNLSLTTELSIQRYIEEDVDKLIESALLKSKDLMCEIKF